jgi:hypothetical protein
LVAFIEDAPGAEVCKFLAGAGLGNHSSVGPSKKGVQGTAREPNELVTAAPNRVSIVADAEGVNGRTRQVVGAGFDDGGAGVWGWAGIGHGRSGVAHGRCCVGCTGTGVAGRWPGIRHGGAATIRDATTVLAHGGQCEGKGKQKN